MTVGDLVIRAYAHTGKFIGVIMGLTSILDENDIDFKVLWSDGTTSLELLDELDLLDDCDDYLEEVDE